MRRRLPGLKAVAWVAATLAAAALLWTLVTVGPSGRDTAAREAPDFSFPDVKGRPTALSDFRGKVVLLDFWATWCEPCLEEMPDLARFYETHKASSFTIVGVAMDAEGAPVVAPFVRQNGISYPILVSGGDLPDGYPIPGFPSAFLIDKNGLIVRRYLGPKSYEELERDLAQLTGG